MPNQVEMNVKNFLSAFFSDVELKFVAGEVFLLRYFFRRSNKMSKKRLLFRCGFGYRRDMLFWYNE